MDILWTIILPTKSEVSHLPRFQIPAMPLTNCMTMDKLPGLSVSKFCHLQNEGNSIYLWCRFGYS